ncbi:MAG: 1-acyl-sn-glycerol-3-phosphate acyltransferase PLS1-like [Acidobacteria bacterium]|nr:1-acyl-sn-glycerol-3-phosphate acyltransferase PLS1-like [Acidobacteriota bacterium]
MPLARLPRAKPWPVRLRQAARGLLVALWLSASLLGFNLVQTASLLLRPLSSGAFRRVNRWAADRFWGWCARATLSLHRTRVVFTGEASLPRENAVLIANHQSMTDIQVLFLLARRERRLGDLKWFVKSSLRWLPGVGWGMAFLDCLFVRRDWAEDRRRVERVFRRILGARTPLWLVSFCEGTRLTTERLAQARRYARARALAVPRHVLVPRERGFVASVTTLRGHLGAVYDVTIGYVDGLPSLWQWAQGRMREVHLDVRRYAVGELPSAPEALADWLRARFEEKDARLERFYRAGSFA